MLQRGKIFIRKVEKFFPPTQQQTLYVDLVGSHMLPGLDLLSVNKENSEKDSTENISEPYSPLHSFPYQSWLRERVISTFYFYCNLSSCSPCTETFTSAASSLVVKGKTLPPELRQGWGAWGWGGGVGRCHN